MVVLQTMAPQTPTLAAFPVYAGLKTVNKPCRQVLQSQKKLLQRKAAQVTLTPLKWFNLDSVIGLIGKVDNELLIINTDN